MNEIDANLGKNALKQQVEVGKKFVEMDQKMEVMQKVSMTMAVGPEEDDDDNKTTGSKKSNKKMQ